MSAEALVTIVPEEGVIALVANGDWTIRNAQELDNQLRGLSVETKPGGAVEIDLSAVGQFDTTGAWLLHRTRNALEADGVRVSMRGETDTQRILLDEIRDEAAVDHVERRKEMPALERMIIDMGQVVINAGQDLANITALFGRSIIFVLLFFVQPWKMRSTAVTHHLEHAGLRAVPIVGLMSFLIGCIIAQQGSFQLRRFGAEILTIDLVGILVLREIGVLLTSIMVAGRSGSAYTAELGSMKMREEVDALHVIGLDPVEVLIVPRLVALVIALPLLTVVSNFAAMTGAGLVTWLYVGIAPINFIEYLRDAVDFSTMAVGMIKAPFMALIIGLIACLEGMNVGGSAESLGKHTTSAVVKSIFMVIVVDGMFAMFFAAVDF